MKRVFFLAMLLVFSLTTTKAFAQAAPEEAKPAAPEAVKPAAPEAVKPAPEAAKPAPEVAKKDAPAGKLSLADLEGMTEEQILALMKTLDLEDILYYLRMAVSGGTRELLVNMLGALNAYMASLDPEKAKEVAQKAVADNPLLSFGVDKNGNVIVFVGANDEMNNLVTTSNNTQEELNDSTSVVSGTATK